MSWHVRAVALPDDDGPTDSWIDDRGCQSEQPLDDAERLPGDYSLYGLVDAHAHPCIGAGATGPVALNAAEAEANLAAWSRAGVTVVRDVGSPGGLSLTLELSPGSPKLHAAGRFFAPAGRYFPALLPAAAPESELTALALAEVARGARWIKIIGDFPPFVDGEPTGPPQPTYSLEAIAAVARAAHGVDVRVAVHSTIDNVADLVRSGVDSIEHGNGIDDEALELMAANGVAWTPTLSAVFSVPEGDLDPARRERRGQYAEALRALLPKALGLGVPILTGSDAVGTIAKEVRLLAAHGLSGLDAVRSATTTAYEFLDIDVSVPSVPTCVVTYDADPREDPAVLGTPRAVLVDGIRIR